MSKPIRERMDQVCKALLCLSLAVVLFWSNVQRAEASQPVEIDLQAGTKIILQQGDAYSARPGSGQTLKLYLDDLFLVTLDGNNAMSAVITEAEVTPDMGGGILLQGRYLEVGYDESDKLSLYCYSNVPDNQGNVTEAPNDSRTCHHDFEWEVQREATSTESGLEYYKCKKCGYVKTELDISGFMSFVREVADSISKAEVGATLIFNTEMWNSFPKIIIDAFRARKDVTVTINYKYEGKHYTVTIPAGADLAPLVNEEGYIGFRNLDAAFGGSEVEK